MLAFAKIIGLLRCRLHSRKQKRAAYHPVRSLKRSTLHSFSPARSAARSSPSSPPPSACSPLPGRPLDIVIHNLHADAWGTARAARPIAVETLLAHMLAVVARRHIHLHSVAATPFSITLVIDDALEAMATAAAAEPSSEKPASQPADSKQSFRFLVSELVNAVDGIDLREKDFICEENRRSRILGQRRKHEW